jgi:methionyl-tRNA formyltransferase
MRLAILTTETTHHLHFVRELARENHDMRVFCETRSAAPPFPIAHEFEVEREHYEAETWFSAGKPAFGSLGEALYVEDINGNLARAELSAFRPEATLVFGTGRVKSPILSLDLPNFLNFHGGNPERYRGLDNHLWAIYHGDAESIVATLHVVAAELDAGDIVFIQSVPIRPEMQLHQLRAANTQVCVNLARLAMLAMDRGLTLPKVRQSRQGRYYSFMPAELKSVCVRKFSTIARGRADA